LCNIVLLVINNNPMQGMTNLNKLQYILFVFLIFNIISCRQKHGDLYTITKSATGDSAMVVTAHPLATSVGLQILKEGGNAVDAAIAVQFALAVCYPGAGNIGGGGFMVYRAANGSINSLDFREKAPGKATQDMYLDSLGNAQPEKSLYGVLASGVPGTVDGMFEAYNTFSKLKDWKKLVQPAIDIARNGFRITEREAKNLHEDQNVFGQNNQVPTAFHPKEWQAGDLLVQQDLANTLTVIRDQGRSGFYKGDIAALIVAEMKKSGGLISHEDLENYKSVWRAPLTGNYRGYKIISMPPPSSGGVALLQLLKITERHDVSKLGFQTPASIHLMAEAERRVFADRSEYLGDPDYTNVPVAKLLDSLYLINRMKDFNPRQASRSNEITHGIIEREETTHFSIVDKEGNAVAITTTLNGNYGAYTVVQGAGFILNNEMDDFSVKPGSPNMYGLIGAEANKIEPGKRMLSSMTPTIIEKDGKLAMILGTPGGSTIITSVYQVILNMIDFNMSASEAVNAPRFHHQWLPDVILCEKDAVSLENQKILEAIGHSFKERGAIGRFEAIQKTSNGKIYGAADKRGDDDAKGY
jgi:gamma-glutamyltranspeptidase/glutathione hydrolase